MIYSDTIVTIQRDRPEVMAIVNKIDNFTRERKQIMKKLRSKEYKDFKERKDLRDRVDVLAMNIRHQKGYLYMSELH